MKYARNLLAVLAVSAFSTTASHAFGPTNSTAAAQSKKEYCEAAATGQNFKLLYANDDNILSFTNHGGMSNGGVCWWHSRFTRLANYLMVFRPELPRADARTAKWIIDRISSGKQVIEVPGYRNLREFSRDWERLIQGRLESWQREDAFLKFAWVKGLKGGTALTSESMRQQMDFMYNEVINEKRVIWTRLQVPGIAAHAWLVIDMKPTADGYELIILDSNHRSAKTVLYHNGDHNLSTSAGRGVPTVDNWSEMFAAGRAVRYYCGWDYFPDWAD